MQLKEPVSVSIAMIESHLDSLKAAHSPLAVAASFLLFFYRNSADE